jgi:hypothetical protein
LYQAHSHCCSQVQSEYPGPLWSQPGPRQPPRSPRRCSHRWWSPCPGPCPRLRCPGLPCAGLPGPGFPWAPGCAGPCDVEYAADTVPPVVASPAISQIGGRSRCCPVLSGVLLRESPSEDVFTRSCLRCPAPVAHRSRRWRARGADDDRTPLSSDKSPRKVKVTSRSVLCREASISATQVATFL